MAKDRSEKKERKEKKEKRSETDGVTKKSKKDKKEKNSKTEDHVEAVVEKSKAPATSLVNGKKDDEEMSDVEEEKALSIVPKEALVPFANPLADEKQTKKLLKYTKKANKNKTLKRGVKEVVKAIRKSEHTVSTKASPGVVILAADISPMDVISHIPVLCEDHNIPYIYVTSRAELGAAGNTKRPTSVVMISRDRRQKEGSKDDKEADAEYAEVFSDLLKLVLKAGATVKI